MAATHPTGDEQAIRERVLRGLALNREPGLPFRRQLPRRLVRPRVAAASRLSLEPGPHCVDADGQVDLGSFAMLADLALAATVRANLERAQRLATVSMNLELTGVPRTGRLEAAGEFHGFFSEGSGRLGQSRVVVTGGAGEVAFGSGSFMALRPPAGVTMHPAPNRRRDDAPRRSSPLPGSSATSSRSCSAPTRRSRASSPTAAPSSAASGAMRRAAWRAALPRR